MRKEVESELDVEDELGQRDADEEPRLCAEALASLVRYEGVVLPAQNQVVRT
jgi:hypothetical protein